MYRFLQSFMVTFFQMISDVSSWSFLMHADKVAVDCNYNTLTIEPRFSYNDDVWFSAVDEIKEGRLLVY